MLGSLANGLTTPMTTAPTQQTPTQQTVSTKLDTLHEHHHMTLTQLHGSDEPAITHDDQKQNDAACPITHRLVLSIAEGEAVFQTATHDDMAPHRLLIDQPIDTDEVEYILENGYHDVPVPYNPQHTPASYDITLNDIWPYPCKELWAHYENYYNTYMQV